MSVDITFSYTAGGVAISPILDLGSGGYNNNQPSAVQLYIRHNGTQPITNCRLYVAPLSGSYVGVNDAQTDYDNVIIGGNDGNQLSGHSDGSVGFIRYSLDDGGTWTTINSTTGGSLSEPIELGALAANTNLSLQLKFVFFNQIINSLGNPVTSLGSREFDLRLTYTYTI